MFGPRPRLSEKRSKNLTVRLSEEEFAEVQRMARQMAQRTGVRYSAGDLIREGLRSLQAQLAAPDGPAAARVSKDPPG